MGWQHTAADTEDRHRQTQQTDTADTHRETEKQRHTKQTQSGLRWVRRYAAAVYPLLG